MTSRRSKLSTYLQFRFALRDWARGWGIERCASLLALLGVTASIFSGFNVRTFQGSGSDFKTLYASAWCFAHGLDAYQFTGLGSVFISNHVILPHSWYAHAPVYPPFTLALIAIFTVFPMVPAVYIWIVLSAAIMTCALAALVRVAGDTFDLGRPWRLLLIAIFAASPLLSFGLEMGNVSVIVAALCILAIFAPNNASPWPRAVALTIALILKPHVALWVLLALFLLPERGGRAIAWRTLPLIATFLSVCALVMATTHQLVPQIASYCSMVHAELAGGSMDPISRQIIAVAAQITSLDSLLGFWLASPVLPFGKLAVLVGLAGFLLWASTTARAREPMLRLNLIAAWCAFGMLATYHRAHDATILLFLLPWTFARLRSSWSDGAAWGTLLLLAMLSVGPNAPSFQHLATFPHWHALAEFLLYRQSSLAAMLLALVLIGTAVHEQVRQRQGHPRRLPSRYHDTGLNPYSG